MNNDKKEEFHKTSLTCGASYKQYKLTILSVISVLITMML